MKWPHPSLFSEARTRVSNKHIINLNTQHTGRGLSDGQGGVKMAEAQPNAHLHLYEADKSNYVYVIVFVQGATQAAQTRKIEQQTNTHAWATCTQAKA